jgi:hypothetical protein
MEVANATKWKSSWEGLGPRATAMLRPTRSQTRSVADFAARDSSGGWPWGGASVSGWDRENTAPAGDSTGPPKMKSRELKRNTVVHTGCSLKWAIRTLVGVVTHEVPLPGAPTVGV